MTERNPLMTKRRARELSRAAVAPTPDLASMSKDEIEAYTLEEHGIDLDKRRTLESLLQTVEALEAT